MKIRKAKTEDSEEITKLIKRTIREVNSKNYSEEVIREWAKNIKKKNMEKEIKKTNFYVAEKEKKTVGLVNFTEEGELYHLYVDSKHLNEGIGTELLEKAEEKVREKEIEKIKGYSTLTAQEFFQKKRYKLKKEIEYPLNDRSVKMKRIEKTLEGRK